MKEEERAADRENREEERVREGGLERGGDQQEAPLVVGNRV